MVLYQLSCRNCLPLADFDVAQKGHRSRNQTCVIFRNSGVNTVQGRQPFYAYCSGHNGNAQRKSFHYLDFHPTGLLRGIEQNIGFAKIRKNIRDICHNRDAVEEFLWDTRLEQANIAPDELESGLRTGCPDTWP